MNIPGDILSLMGRLRAWGIRSFVVGGAVRDMLMGRSPDDYDLAAECTPEELCRVFEGYKSFDAGIKFGTLSVFSGERFVEITCCRSDGNYKDCRRPDSVEYCRDIKEDLRRRDFTVNAIALDENMEFTDPFGGRADIERGIIRTVGNAEERFCEDALRIMRAARFASALGFETEESTKKAAEEKRGLLKNIASERIFAELKKLLLGDNVVSALLEYRSIIFEVIPELLETDGFWQNNPHHVYTVYEHTVRSVGAAPRDIRIRLCMLFHDIAKPQRYTVDDKGVGHFYGHPEVSARIAEKALRRLKADGETIRFVCFLIKYHDTRPEATKKSLHKYLSKVGFEGARDLFSVRRADLGAQSPEFFYLFDYLAESERIVEELEREGACVKVSDLCVNGNDLMELGLPAGKEIGDMLSYLLSKVVLREIENSRVELLSLAKKKISRKA